jgi:pyrimidine-specific ribonucleoside hydrolase
MTKAQPIDIWLDVDTSNGLVLDGRVRDVDDGLTIVMALHSPEARVVGLSTVFGNADIDNATKVARDVLDRFGAKDMPVHRGSASGDDFGKENDATRALAAALKDRPLHVLALGPVTNVATVVKLHPELKAQIRSILVVAARRPGFDFHPPGRPELKFPDANFEKDVPGTQLLLDSGIPIVFAGYEVSSDTWLTRDHLKRVAAEGGDGGKWLAETSEKWLSRWETVQKLPGFNPFDTLALAYLTHPQLVTGIKVTAHITTGPDDRATHEQRQAGKTKAYLICEPTDDASSKLLYLTAAKKEFVEVLAERLIARPKE